MSSSLAEERPWLPQQPRPPKQTSLSLTVQVIWLFLSGLNILTGNQALHASKRVFLLLPVPLPLKLESDKCCIKLNGQLVIFPPDVRNYPVSTPPLSIRS